MCAFGVVSTLVVVFRYTGSPSSGSSSSSSSSSDDTYISATSANPYPLFPPRAALGQSETSADDDDDDDEPDAADGMVSMSSIDSRLPLPAGTITNTPPPPTPPPAPPAAAMETVVPTPHRGNANISPERPAVRMHRVPAPTPPPPLLGAAGEPGSGSSAAEALGGRGTSTVRSDSPPRTMDAILGAMGTLRTRSGDAGAAAGGVGSSMGGSAGGGGVGRAALLRFRSLVDTSLLPRVRFVFFDSYHFCFSSHK